MYSSVSVQCLHILETCIQFRLLCSDIKPARINLCNIIYIYCVDNTITISLQCQFMRFMKFSADDLLYFNMAIGITFIVRFPLQMTGEISPQCVRLHRRLFMLGLLLLFIRSNIKMIGWYM